MAYSATNRAGQLECLRRYERNTRGPRVRRERAETRRHLLKPCASCGGKITDRGKGPIAFTCSRKCWRAWWRGERL